MTNPLMKCGCVGSARTTGNRPVCVVHYGLVPGADQIADEEPNLEGRTATCSYGEHSEVASSLNLAYFTYQPTHEKDLYYCGCYGWD